MKKRSQEFEGEWEGVQERMRRANREGSCDYIVISKKINKLEF